MTHYREGKLSAALASATAAVKANPGDISARTVLASLLCFAREWDRADKHLAALVNHGEKYGPGGNLFRQLIRAELARNETFENGRIPEFIGEDTGLQGELLKAMMDWRQGDFGAVAKRHSELLENRPTLQGRCDGEPFVDFGDMDDLMSLVLEGCTASGDYVWVDLNCISSIGCNPVETMRDSIWRSSRIETRSGATSFLYLCNIYHGKTLPEDESLALGQATDWIEQGDLVTGVGRRCFKIGDDLKSIFEFTKITFDEGA